ncbi:hypothetical protein F2Q70_00011695 [Brassica cretica]|uniref:Uncharacterized protein n=1 Tax=Brassica cretica TaxID=69181 RepID=A0A8S9M6T8_BRACR|nr:hypothetical protein F2Q70_00011695 [Brassica cretica]
MLSKLPKTPVQPKAHRGPKSTNRAIKVLLLQTWKAAKPGTWVITPTPAPSKPVPVLVLPRKAEYAPCEKQNILGSQGTPGPYTSPRSKEETQGSPYSLQGFKDKKEVRTPVQPKFKAHRGHYIPKNLRVPMRPQGINTPGS